MSQTRLLADGNGMRMPARNQRQVDTGYVDEQGYRDTEEPYPKPPIAVGTFPVGTMNMRFMMMTMYDLIHLYPAFLVHFVSRTTEIQKTPGSCNP